MLQLKDNAAGAGGGDRWQRAQLKRLRQVLALKASRDEGQTLSEAQEAKLKTEGRLRADLSAMGCDLSAVESEIRATAKVAGGGSNNKKRKRPDDKPGSGSAQQVNPGWKG